MMSNNYIIGQKIGGFDKALIPHVLEICMKNKINYFFILFFIYHLNNIIEIKTL